MNLGMFKSKPVIYGMVAAAVGLVLYKVLSPSPPNIQMTTTNDIASPDLAVIQSAQQFQLANKQIDASKDVSLAQLSNSLQIAEIGKSIIGMNNQAALDQLNAQQGYQLNAQESAQDYAYKSLLQNNALEQYKMYTNQQISQSTLDQQERLGVASIASHERISATALNLSHDAAVVDSNNQLLIAHEYGVSAVETAKANGSAQAAIAKSQSNASTFNSVLGAVSSFIPSF